MLFEGMGLRAVASRHAVIAKSCLKMDGAAGAAGLAVGDAHRDRLLGEPVQVISMT